MTLIDYKNHRGTFTDFYQLTMIAGYFQAGIYDQPAVFDYFIRKNPFNSGYTVFSGIQEIVDYITNLHFDSEELSYIDQLNIFPNNFLEWLTKFKFTGTITGVLDGTIVFPYDPILTVRAPLYQAQLVETALLNIANFQSLIATKAARISSAAYPGKVIEFGLRRAQGDAGMLASKAAMIGGCVGTSNVRAGLDYNIPISGTQSHAWIQSFSNELESFKKFVDYYGEKSILLVDTYDTLRSGVPNAIKIAIEFLKKGIHIRGIRIDSGDLAYLSVESAKMLDKAGLSDLRIILSNDLDEYVIESIKNEILSNTNINNGQDKKFFTSVVKRLDYGVGTNLVSGGNQAALNGVYKLVEINNVSCLKISENIEKISNPGYKNLWRIYTEDGEMIFDIIGLKSEKSPETGQLVHHVLDVLKETLLPSNITVEELHKILVKDGKMMIGSDSTNWRSGQERCSKQLKQLDKSHQRLINPHVYKVSLTDELFNLKLELIHQHKFK